ncbi:26S proteasome non-ATPase regulatory subunit 5-like [Dreissena polymorpha]|nr:26S proteasome non-ATPase regulatory subunit 5-like [Dreissena polymorpha]
MAASIAALIDSLPNSENKLEVLADLKAVLGNTPIQSISSISANVSFSSVFECLSTDNGEELEMCCEVLQKLLSPLPPDVILTQFHDELLTGLQHDELPVRKLCLSQILRVSDNSSEELTQHEDILVKLVKALADESLDVAKSASQVLTKLGSSEEGLSTLYSENLMSTIQDVLLGNDTIRFRVYETIVNISGQCEAGLRMSFQSGLLQQFLNELHKDDILVQLNCLELLSHLASSEHGLAYLKEHDVIARLETMLRSAQDDPLAGFLIPGLIKFFGCVARLYPKEVCSQNESFVATVFNNLSSPENPSMLSLAVQTVGFIGSSIEGKMALEKLGNKMDTGMRCIGKVLRESQQDMKITILQALSCLMRLKIEDQTSELLKLTERWYNCLGSNTFSYLMSLATQPFPELRFPLLALLEALAGQMWAQNIMSDHPGFREYLLDRSTEKTKECKEWKYNLVLTLAKSPTVSEVFGPPYVVQLKVYCNQGPFFVRAQAEVAMEGDS